MTTAVTIINQGLSKIAASRVASIDPPKTNLERYMLDNYAQWRDEELSARRWRFALRRIALTQTGEKLEETDQPYRYLIPNDALMPVREKDTEWEQRGTYLYSAYDKLEVEFITRVPERDFAALFVGVLACKIAMESAEYVTQSNTKKDDLMVLYKEAVSRAGRANSFVTGSESLVGIKDDDKGYSWVTERWGYG